ncbi:MAG TPA: T9SS type A sorting domain-containing protein [Saprospiraceae bacterium]|nr:T9SS type A sorting domain-containing protein [Saprospiraceae bacterium]
MKTIIILLCSTLFIPGLFSQTFHPSEINFYKDGNHNSAEEITASHGVLQKNLNQFQFRSEEDVLDSLHTWSWDTLSVQWQLTRRTFYTSNESNHIISELNLVQDGAQWINEGLYTYSYDGNNNYLGYQYQVWNGIDWENSEQMLYTYDDHNNQTSIVAQVWDGANWINQLARFYTYDINDNQIDIVYVRWTGTEWENVFHHIFTYDVDNRLVHRLIQNWTTGWVDNQQLFYTYDANYDLVKDSLQRWVVDHWEDYYRNFYTYDVHHDRTLYLRQANIGGGIWVDEQRFFYTYDQNGDILNQLYQTFTNGEWLNVYQFLVTYDSQRHLSSEVFQLWDSTWVNQDSFQYYYTLATGTKDFGPDPFGIFVYPNPATSYLEIELADLASDEISVEIFSGNGVLQLKSLINPNEKKRLDISRLSPGEYHVMIRTTKGVIVKNFVKW